jgi:hypothetical protein
VAQRHVAKHHDVNASARDVARLTLLQHHRRRGTADVLMGLAPMPVTGLVRQRGSRAAYVAAPELG